MGISKLSDVDVVSSTKNSGKSGVNLNDEASGESAAPKSQGDPREPKPKPKKGPGRREIPEEEKLADDYLDRIGKAVGLAPKGDSPDPSTWNIGGIPNLGRPGSSEGTPVEIKPAEKGPDGEAIEAPQVPGNDTRVWVDPSALEEEIDKLNKQAEQEDRVAQAGEQAKEERTDSEKTTGGKGKGRGTIRDRIKVERLSQTNWAGIFKTRLSAYSSEKGSSIPYERRLLSNPTIGRRVSSKVQKRDVIPELNLLIDTSSSLSYKEMAVILGEIEMAMKSAKVNILNVFLWHHQPYAFKTFTKVKSDDFAKIRDWVQSRWEGGGNDEALLYDYIVKQGKAKKFTISLTDAYLSDHMKEGKVKSSWTKAFDASNLIFAIIYPNKRIPFSAWQDIANRMPGTKVPVFLDSKKFK